MVTSDARKKKYDNLKAIYRRNEDGKWFASWEDIKTPEQQVGDATNALLEIGYQIGKQDGALEATQIIMKGMSK